MHTKEARRALAELQARAAKINEAASMKDATKPSKKEAASVENDMEVEPTQVVETQVPRPIATPAGAAMIRGVSTDAQPREQELWDQRFGGQDEGHGERAGNETSLNCMFVERITAVTSHDLTTEEEPAPAMWPPAAHEPDDEDSDEIVGPASYLNCC